MASITPITATQLTQQSTSSLTFVSANCATSALANGVDYLVIYSGNCGSSDTLGEAQMRIVHGSTVLGEVRAEGRGLDQHWDSTVLSGFTRITGNGTDTLAFEIASEDNNDTCYAGAMRIIAIPLTELTENSDYWFSGTDSATDENTNATVNGWDTQRSVTWNLPETGDYLVLMSNEASLGSDGALTRFRVAGATIGGEYEEEWEDADDRIAFQIAHLDSLSSGNNTFAVEVGSLASATADFRRSRIFVLKASAFDQIIQATDTTGISTTSATYVDYTALNQTYTPNQQEYVVGLGHVVGGNSTTQTGLMQIWNNTDSTAFCTDAGEYNNGNSTDVIPILPLSVEQISTAKAYRIRVRADGGTGEFGGAANQANTPSYFILWGLTTVEAAADEGFPIFAASL